MKGIVKVLLYIALVAILAAVGGSTFGFFGGLIGFFAGVAVLFVINRATVFYVIGQRKYNAGDHTEAYKWMKKAYDTTRLKPGFALLYAYMMIRDGMLDEAEAVINKVTYLNSKEMTKSDKIDATLNRSIIIWKQNDLSEAIEILEEVYEKGLKSTTFYGTLGFFYLLANQNDKALEFNKEAYEYNSNNMIIKDNLGASYIASGEFEKADEVYSKLFEQNPEFMEPYYNYGMLMEKRGRYDIAKTYYEKALEFPEKYLSTISQDEIKAAIENVDMYAEGEKGNTEEEAE